jgi:hypothetical protein
LEYDGQAAESLADGGGCQPSPKWDYERGRA